MRYPGDPPVEVTFLTGAEFVAHERHGKPGEIRVSSWDSTAPPHVIEFDEVVCDLCNAEIGDADMCALHSGHLYCPHCMVKYVLDYVKEEEWP